MKRDNKGRFVKNVDKNLPPNSEQYLHEETYGIPPRTIKPTNFINLEYVTPSNFRKMPNPTEEQLSSREFDAIWQTIKKWDINVPDAYCGYMGANGSHVAEILNALNPLISEWKRIYKEYGELLSKHSKLKIQYNELEAKYNIKTVPNTNNRQIENGVFIENNLFSICHRIGINPRSYQWVILNGLTNGDNIIYNGCRQCGKSLIIALYTAYLCHYSKNKVIGLFSPTQVMSSLLKEKICEFLKRLKIPYIDLCNSIIIEKSNVRLFFDTELKGHSYDYMFFDEFAYMSNADDIYNHIKLYLINQSKVQTFIASTQNASHPCGAFRSLYTNSPFIKRQTRGVNVFSIERLKELTNGMDLYTAGYNYYGWV